jgi:AraC-like DNA-binding protein
VFVPAGTRHIMHFTGGPIACLYADPAAGADVAALAGEMRVAAGKLRFHHRREGELSALFRKFAARALHRDELQPALRTIQQGSDLTSAALDAGFSSSAHFSNAYRGMFGMTPSALMQAERESRARASHA